MFMGAGLPSFALLWCCQCTFSSSYQQMKLSEWKHTDIHTIYINAGSGGNTTMGILKNAVINNRVHSLYPPSTCFSIGWYSWNVNTVVIVATIKRIWSARDFHEKKNAHTKIMKKNPVCALIKKSTQTTLKLWKYLPSKHWGSFTHFF